MHLSKETAQVKSQLCSVLNGDKLASLPKGRKASCSIGATLAGGKLGGSWKGHSFRL